MVLALQGTLGRADRVPSRRFQEAGAFAPWASAQQCSVSSSGDLPDRLTHPRGRQLAQTAVTWVPRVRHDAYA